MKLSIEQIARICHESIRTLCAGIEERVLPPWQEASISQRVTMREAVRYLIENSEITPEQAHEKWVEIGCLFRPNNIPQETDLDYNQLPPEQKKKEQLFYGTVKALTRL